jgi:hypothetical protein
LENEFFKKYITVTGFLKKIYQDLVGNLQDFLNLFRSNMIFEIFQELKRSCKDIRSCSIVKDLEQELVAVVVKAYF